MYRIILFIFIVIFFNSCGSNNENKTGYFIDAPVSGIEYTCGSQQGFTGENGEFIYNSSCKVIFTVGGIVLGEINGEDINTDSNVLPSDKIGRAHV